MNRRSFLSNLAMAPLAAVIARQSKTLDFVSFSQPDVKTNSASMWIYLWDLVDEGYESVFARLQENGLTGISLAAAYHGGKFLAPHNPRHKVIFPEDGTVYFNPQSKAYGRIHPRINSLVKSGHSLQAVKKVADKKGLTTRAWVVCCHNTPLGMQYPDIAAKDVFGDPIYHNLCPSNDDVRHYLRTLIADIAGCGVDTIELEALQFQGYTHGYTHEREGIELNAASRFLLGLCFCSACAGRASSAGFDFSQVRSFTRNVLEAWFSDPAVAMAEYPSFESLPKEIFDPFLRWRQSVVRSLLDELATSAGSCKLRQLISVDPLARTLVSVDPVSSARSTGGILALGYVKDGAALRKPLTDLQREIGDAEMTVGFQVGLPESGGRDEFLSRMSTAQDLGIKSYNFYNYGFIPYRNLGWIRKALS